MKTDIDRARQWHCLTTAQQNALADDFRLARLAERAAIVAHLRDVLGQPLFADEIEFEKQTVSTTPAAKG